MPSTPKITIVGGGPAGCATALALHARGLTEVTVVEAGDYATQRIGESLPPDIGPMFARMGILADFLAEAHETCVGSCSAWGSDALGYNDFIASPLGPGWHLDRLKFERFLARQVRERGMRLMHGTRFRQVHRRPKGGFELEFIGPDREPMNMQSDWVVDAGGLQALLASRLGARKRIHDQLVVISQRFTLTEDARMPRLSLLEAVDCGWWYAARLPGEQAIVMLASDAAMVRQLNLNSAKSFALKLAQTRHLSTALGSAEAHPSKFSVVLAASSQLEFASGPGWLAVGDAAASFDPITARGIHKAFVDADAAARALQTQTESPRGASSSALAYQYHVDSQFNEYLEQRARLYALEQRWPDSEFWQRRQHH